jgi:hypothetical protein
MKLDRIFPITAEKIYALLYVTRIKGALHEVLFPFMITSD